MRLLLLVAWLACGCGGGKGGGIFTPDGGSGIVCGGFAGTQCPADEFCDFPRDDCGATDGTGTCKPRPLGCDDVLDPVCGCDGEVHSNSCDANTQGVDLSAIGSCPAEPGSFACGPRFCEISTQFCHVFGSDIADEPDGFSCSPLPAGCTLMASCACLAEVGCNDRCDGDEANGFTVVCFGG